MIEHRLANVLLQVEPHAAAYPDIWYRAAEGATECVEGAGAEAGTGAGVDEGTTLDTSAAASPEAGALRITGPVDFTTYLNGISSAKWRRYTGINDIRLHLELEGDGCDLVLEGVPERGDELVTCGTVRVSAGQGTVDVRIPTEGMTVSGFAIRPAGEVLLRRAYYYAQVDEDQVNHANLAVSTTTFKKEDFIVPNVRKLCASVLADEGPVRDHFHIFVVDNGRTLTPADFAAAHDLVTLIPNDNVGGSGGAARGMIAVLDDPVPYTHVLLMDDDIALLPEAVKRAYNLLDLAQGPYRDACVEGAMLTLEEPNLQFEDVSVLERKGRYHRIKEDLRISRLENAVQNELIDVERPNAYGAWWFSCVPVVHIRDKGLPLPLFIRWDDVEFGVRQQTRYMTMNGICVWHQGFAGKFRGSVDLYQHIRNFLIVSACDGVTHDRIIAPRITRDIRLRLRDYDYIGAEFLLNAIEDYLRGPGYFSTVDGSALMREKGAQNEKMVPLEELDLAPETLAEVARLRAAEEALLERDPNHIFAAPLPLRLIQSLPYDPHKKKNAALDPTPAVFPYHGHDVARPNLLRHSTLLALDTSFENGVLRHMDRARYQRDVQRLRDLTARWRREGAAIRQAYRDAFPRLVSEDFWRAYLGMER